MLPQPLPAPVAGARAHGRRARERYIQARRHAALPPPLPVPVAGGTHCTRSRTLDPRVRGLCLGTSFSSMPGCRPHSHVLPTTLTHTLQDRSRRACLRVQCPSTSARDAPVAAAHARRRSPCSQQACSRALCPSTSARGAPVAAARTHRRSPCSQQACSRALCPSTSARGAPVAAARTRRRSPRSRQACSRALCPSTSARGAPAAAARAHRRQDALHAFSHTRSSRARTLPWYVILIHAWLSPALTRAPHHAHTHPPGPLAVGMLESAMSKHIGTRRSRRRCPRPSQEPALAAGMLESATSKHVGMQRSRRHSSRTPARRRHALHAFSHTTSLRARTLPWYVILVHA